MVGEFEEKWREKDRRRSVEAVSKVDAFDAILAEPLPEELLQLVAGPAPEQRSL